MSRSPRPISRGTPPRCTARGGSTSPRSPAPLACGYHQGWDLHPAQIPVRYAAVYAFFLADLDAAAARLSAFVESAARARTSGAVFDDAATGQGLLNAFLRALNAGAIGEAEAAAATGLSVEELRGRSFQRIVAARAG